MRGSGPNKVADILSEVLKRSGIKRGVRRAEAVLLWPQVIGPEGAKFTHAKALHDGVLYIHVSDSETAMHLSMQRQRFLDVFHAKFGVRSVRDLRFKVGAVPAPEPRAEPAEPHIDPHELTQLTRVVGEADLPYELARPAMKLAKAIGAHRARCRARGFKPCPTCDALTDTGGLCASCERYRRDPRVQQAARDLITDPLMPMPQLSHEERRVAQRAAKSSLEDHMFELLPHVLADPTCKPQLESAAHCYLTLVVGKPLPALPEDHYDLLDARVARALGRWG